MYNVRSTESLDPAVLRLRVSLRYASNMLSAVHQSYQSSVCCIKDKDKGLQGFLSHRFALLWDIAAHPMDKLSGKCILPSCFACLHIWIACAITRVHGCYIALHCGQDKI
jgi:hypothetical protein